MTATQAFERARRIADAVLYEGYVLYPYRASSAKNQMRWQFGVLAPRAFCDQDPSEHWFNQTECIAEVAGGARLDLKVRGLQVQSRTVERPVADGFEAVAFIDTGTGVLATWDEAVEQEIDIESVALGDAGRRSVPFHFPGRREVEDLGAAGRVVRERHEVSGAVEIEVTPVAGVVGAVKVKVRVENLTDWVGAGSARVDVMLRSFVGVHCLLHARHAELVSATDPTDETAAAVAACENVHTWPVMVGEVGDRSTILSSPIILSDHPEVAPESPGDMCDATEIDEILALRVLTLTDDEKRQARGTDPRAAAIIDRVDDFAPEVFERLHGAVRSLRPAPEDEELRPWWDPEVDAAVDPWQDSIIIGGLPVRKGSRVRLRPGPAGGRRTDAQDLFLVGMVATVAGVFHDVDGDQHVAVTIDDDPAAELHQAHGRFLYFHPDEVEPLP